MDATKVYDLIDGMRKELKGDIAAMGTTLATSQGRLEKKFDDLEAGRLTAAEAEINKLKIGQATMMTKLAIGGFITATIVGSVVSALIAKFVH